MSNVISFCDKKKEVQESNNIDVLTINITMNVNGYIDIQSNRGGSYDDISLIIDTLQLCALDMMEKYLTDNLR